MNTKLKKHDCYNVLYRVKKNTVTVDSPVKYGGEWNFLYKISFAIFLRFFKKFVIVC